MLSDRYNYTLQQGFTLQAVGFVLFCITATCGISFAQDAPVEEQDLQTLFPKTTVYGLVGGSESRISWFNDHPALFVGGDISWLINHRYVLGGVHLQSINKIAGTNRNMTYGGVLLGYIGYPFRVLHVSVELLTGAGKLHSGEFDADDAFVIFEPGVKVQINLSDLVRLSMGMSHRFTTYAKSLNESELNGTSMTLGLSFGLF